MFSELLDKLHSKKVVVIGAGGLGGNIVNLISRLGIGKILIFDGDVFDSSNINRQLYCNQLTLGKNKAEVAAEETRKIGISDAEAIPDFFQEKYFPLLKGYDCIIDATDNVNARLYLEQVAIRSGITVIHGAINAYFGQIAVVRPGDKTLSKLYSGKIEPTRETISYIPATVAALQVCQMVKFLSNAGALDREEVLLVDMFSCQTRTIKL